MVTRATKAIRWMAGVFVSSIMSIKNSSSSLKKKRKATATKKIPTAISVGGFESPACTSKFCFQDSGYKGKHVFHTTNRQLCIFMHSCEFFNRNFGGLESIQRADKAVSDSCSRKIT